MTQKFRSFTEDWCANVAAFMNDHLAASGEDVSGIKFVLWENFCDAPADFANVGNDAHWWLELSDGKFTCGLGAREDDFNLHIFVPFEFGAEIATIPYEGNPEGVKRVEALVKQAGDRSGRKAQNWSADADKAAALLAPLHDFVASSTIPALG